MAKITVIKRDGRKVPFNKYNIVDAVLAAFEEVDKELSDYAYIKAGNIADYIEGVAEKQTLTIEEIQDLVVKGLMSTKRKDVAQAYIIYRHERSQARNIKENITKKYLQLNALIKGEDEESRTENSNKDTQIIPTMRDYIAGFTCREIADTVILPSKISLWHRKGIIHFHDTDYSPAMPMTNCCLVNLRDMLDNGTVISERAIETPKSFRTACTITTQISAQVASSQYGGQTLNMAHLAPYVNVSRLKYKTKFPFFTDEQVEELVKDEVADGIQTIQYQLITMSSTNGQAPFCSLFLYIGDARNEQEEKDLILIIEEIFKQRIKGIKNVNGVPITIAFPKLLYVLDENNTKGSKYYYLTQLAALCSAKRLVPDYISAKKMRELKGDVYGCMGCRSFLAGDPEEHRYWGKFNQGVVTLNLPYLALAAGGDINTFWEKLDEALEVCHEALMIRHNSLLGTKSDVAPILWQHGALARLKKGEVIDPLLFGNNSSISLGYAGLWETVRCLANSDLVKEEGRELGKKILQTLNDACEKWKAQDNIGYSIYGSPIESTTYKFAKAIKRDFPLWEGVNDKNYVTNSYHITPSYHIDAFSKLSIESEYQGLSAGGAISYVETPNMENNIEALLEIIDHIYHTIMYAEINTMTSYCQVCGCTDIQMHDDLKFHCPQCGNDVFEKMNIALRICGYISTNPFNEGRAEDIYSRVYHVGEE